MYNKLPATFNVARFEYLRRRYLYYGRRRRRRR